MHFQIARALLRDGGEFAQGREARGRPWYKKMMSNPRPIRDRGKHGPAPGSRTKSFPRWLRAMRPARLLVETAKGPAKRVALLTRADGQVRWRACVEVVVTCGATSVEALDEEGATLGVWDHPVTADELAKIDERTAREAEIRRFCSSFRPY